MEVLKYGSQKSLMGEVETQCIMRVHVFFSEEKR